MNFKQKLYALAITGVLAVLIAALVGLHSVKSILSVNAKQDLLATALKNHIDGDMMHDAVRGDVLRTLLAVKNNDRAEVQEAQKELREHAKRFRDDLDANTALALPANLKDSIKKIKPELESYIAAAEKVSTVALNEPDKLNQFVPDYFKQFSNMEAAGENVSEEIDSTIKQKAQESAAVDDSAKKLIYSFFILSFAGLGFLSYWVILGLVKTLGAAPEEAALIAQKIAAGQLDFSVQYDSQQKNTLIAALAQMLESLRQGNAAASDNLRIKQALDATSSNVMMADVDRKIVYMNKSVEKMLRGVEMELRKALPHFSVDKVIGSNMDIFHKNPTHQSHLLANLTSTYVGNIVIAGLSFRLIANPIYDERGNRLGSVVEWLDRTKEVALEHEMSRILGALETTSTNVMIADPDRKIIYMNKAVESMLRVAEADIRAVLPHFAVDKILGSNMDIFHKNPAHQMKLLETLTTAYTSNIVVGKRHFRLVANPIFSKDGSRLGSVVEWMDRTQEVSVESEVANLVDAAAAGNFKIRISTEGKQGFFLKLADGLNSLTTTADVGLSDVTRVLSALAKGDLTEKITADYSGTFEELKNYCNDTNDSLNDMLGEIRSAADTIFTASSEIAQGNADLSSRTEQQAANLEETASSMEELTSTVKLNADNAKQANVLAEQATTVATDGGALIQQVVHTMNDINESSQKIADIIGVIDGIAFQTNILALNAAVEAARAGDQGRGFAVVASEVRTLAQRSANAAKDIKALISDSVKKIESGNELVGKSGETVKEIVTAIKRVNDIMAEISAASAEQSSGIDEISTAVSQMDEMTQQNAALVEEAAAAAESLQSQADQLTQRVAQFKLAGDTGRVSAARLAAPSRSSSSSKPTKRIAPPTSSGNQDDEWESF